MKICRGGAWKDAHEQIIYEAATCPLCFAFEEITKVEKEKDKLQDELDRAAEAQRQSGTAHSLGSC